MSRPKTPKLVMGSPEFNAALQAYVAARVVEDGDCLRWTGFCFNGHPAGCVGGHKVLIRRALYAAQVGPIPAGKVLACTCDVPLCVVVEHCEPTTYRRIALRCGAQGLMSGLVRSARIAEVKRASSQAKITQADAQAIRASDEPLRVLGDRYGINPATAGRIRNGQARRDFAGNPWIGLGA